MDLLDVHCCDTLNDNYIRNVEKLLSLYFIETITNYYMKITFISLSFCNKNRLNGKVVVLFFTG